MSVRETQEGGDICIPKADSFLFMAETNTILQSNYPPIKITYILPHSKYSFLGLP